MALGVAMALAAAELGIPPICPAAMPAPNTLVTKRAVAMIGLFFGFIRSSPSMCFFNVRHLPPCSLYAGG